MELDKSTKSILIGIIIFLAIMMFHSYWKKHNINNNRVQLNYEERINMVVLSVHHVNRAHVKVLPGNLVKQNDPEVHLGTPEQKLNYAAGSSIDLNGNGEYAVFVGGGAGQNDALLVLKDGKLIDVIDQTNLSSRSATYASVSTDIDHNGLSDLIVAREDGVTLYLNQGKGRFIASKILPASNKTIPVSLAVTDYNKDGHADIFVSQNVHPKLSQSFGNNKHDVKNAVGQNVSNVLLEGVGLGVFEDVTNRTHTDRSNGVYGSKGIKGNTLASAWIDLDEDRLPDLVLAQDSGQLEFYKNTRGASGGKFTSGNQFVRMNVPTGNGYWTSVAAKDIDNDGDMDLLMSNDGVPFGKKTLFDKFFRGNKKTQSHLVLRNDGHFKFTDITKKYLENDLDAGWSAVMENAKLDGHQTHLITDTDQFESKNGVFWLNIAGPKKLYQNPNKNNNNWIGVKLPNGTPFYNATIRVTSVNDKDGTLHKQTKQNINGIGTGNDSNGIVHFDLGHDNRVVSLNVTTIYDGNEWTHPNPKINMIATFRDMKSNPYTAR